MNSNKKLRYKRAIAYLKKSETARKLIETLEDSKRKIYISFVDNDDMMYSFTHYTILFDINSGLILSDGSSVQSAALGLAHEMGHAAQHLNGTYDKLKYDRESLEQNNLEMCEIPIATELGEPVRLTYEDCGTRNMRNSTHYITFVSYGRSPWFYLLPWNWFDSRGYEVHHNVGSSGGR